MVNGIFPNSVQFWIGNLNFKYHFYTNLITADFYLMSAVKLALISVVQDKPISSIIKIIRGEG